MLWLETTLFTTRNHNGSHITSNCLLGSKVQIYILILGQGTGGRGQGAGGRGHGSMVHPAKHCGGAPEKKEGE